MQTKKAQVIIITLWVLLILTILTLSAGHRVSMALRLTRYQKDGLKALYLARAGVNWAIAELKKDNNDYDSLKEDWADSTAKFAKILPNENSTEYAAVSYIALDENNESKTINGVVDEERKINIITRLPGEDNLTTKLLVTLLKKCQECNLNDEQANELAKAIRIWRGDSGGTLNADADEFKNFKKAPFVNAEELLIVFENYYKKWGWEDYQKKALELYQSIKGLISIYPAPALDTLKINVNTVSRDALIILANTLAADDLERNCVNNVINKIIEIRTDPAKGPFKRWGDIIIDVTVGSPDENLFNKIKPLFVVKSNFFRIESTGYCEKATKKIVCFVNRFSVEPGKTIIAWHHD